MMRLSTWTVMALLAVGCIEQPGDLEIEEDQAAVTEPPPVWYDGRTALYTGSPRPVATVVAPYFNGRSWDMSRFEAWGVDVGRRDFVWHVVGDYSDRSSLIAQIEEELGYNNSIGSAWGQPIIGDVTTGVRPVPPRPGGTIVIELAVAMSNANAAFLAP